MPTGRRPGPHAPTGPGEGFVGLAPAPERVLSVGELAAELRDLLEQGIGRVWVVGEVSNLRQPASGHRYFTLKDDAAQLRAVLFRLDGARLPFELEDGLDVLAHAEVTLWPPRGDLQLVVRHLEPRGRGALQLAIEQLRARLEREGLFAEERKRPLPAFPRAIGVVTSAHGAAVRDVIEVTGARWPGVPLIVSPARVQGEGADREIAEALARLEAHGVADVVLLVRGGGSLEDLLPFQSEGLARAIAACRVPVVTGVGHEIDFTIADGVADARAATPSAAAALVLPDRAALAERIGRDTRRVHAAWNHRLAAARARFESARDSLRRVSPRARLAAQGGRLATAWRALARAGQALLASRRARVATAVARLDALSPLAVLSRGYAIVRRLPDGRIVRRPADVSAGSGLRIRLAEGELAARVAESGQD